MREAVNGVIDAVIQSQQELERRNVTVMAFKF